MLKNVLGKFSRFIAPAILLVAVFPALEAYASPATVTVNQQTGSYGQGGVSGDFSNAHGRDITWSNGWRAEWRLTGGWWYNLRDYGSWYNDYTYMFSQNYTLKIFDENRAVVETRDFGFGNGQAEVQWRGTPFSSFTDINAPSIGTDDVITFTFTRRDYPGYWRWNYSAGSTKILANKEKVNVSKVTWNGNSGNGPLNIYDARVSLDSPIKQVTVRENTPGGCGSFYPGLTPDAYYEGLEDAGEYYRVKIRHASYCSMTLESYLLEKTKFSVCQMDSNFCTPEEQQANWIFNDYQRFGNMSKNVAAGTEVQFNDPNSVRQASVSAIDAYPSSVGQWFSHYGLPKSSFQGTSTGNVVDFSNGTLFQKSDFQTSGRFYGWNYATREAFGNGLKNADFDDGNPIPGVRWKTVSDEGFTSTQAEWTAYGAGITTYPIKKAGKTEILAYVQFPSGNLLCRTAGCRELKPVETAGIDTGYVYQEGLPQSVYVKESLTGTASVIPVSGVQNQLIISASPDGSVLMVGTDNAGVPKTYVAKSTVSGFQETATLPSFPGACGGAQFSTNDRYQDGSVSGKFMDWCNPQNQYAYLIRKNGSFKSYDKQSAGFGGISGDVNLISVSRNGKRILSYFNDGIRKFAVANPENRTIAFDGIYSGDWTSPEQQFYRQFTFGPVNHDLFSMKFDYSTNFIKLEKWSDAGVPVEYAGKIPMGAYYTWILDEGKVIYKEQDGKVWVLDVASGTVKRSKFDYLFESDNQFSRGNAVFSGYYVSHGTLGGNQYSVAINLESPESSKLLTSSGIPKGMSFWEGTFRNPETVKKNKIEKIYQKGDETNTVSRNEEGILKMKQFKFLPFFSPEKIFGQ